MNIEEAEALHVELLQNLPGPAGDAKSALSDVVKRHRPEGGADFRRGMALCHECFAEGDVNGWPCGTITDINAYAHVRGLTTL